MIYRHKFLKKVFTEEKQIKEITPQKPLVFIVQQSAFLHYTICSAMKYLGIPYVITTLKTGELEEKRKSMGHEVPCLIYENQVLETNQLIELLCDAFIDDGEFIDFQSRKSLIKQTALIWKELFVFEKLWPYDFPKLAKLGVNNKTSYQTLVLEQLKNLNTNYSAKIIQRSYSKYSQQIPTLETILFVDIIKCVLEHTPESFLDFALRCYFLNLIQLQEKFEKMINSAQPRFLTEPHEVLLESWQQIKEPNFQRVRTNGPRFLFVFGVLTAIYAIYAKP